MEFDPMNEAVQARLRSNPTPPEENEEPVLYCDGCGEGLYCGDDSYVIRGRVYCSDCIEDHYWVVQ